MPPIRRVSSRYYNASVPLQRLSDHSTRPGILDSDGLIIGSGYDVTPIRKVSNGQYITGVPY